MMDNYRNTYCGNEWEGTVGKIDKNTDRGIRPGFRMITHENL